MTVFVHPDDFPDEIRVLLYVKIQNPGPFGCYGGWRPDLFIEQPKGSVEKKLLLCSFCKGASRDALLYQTRRTIKLCCSVCAPSYLNFQIAQMNREVINKRQVRDL